MTCLKSPLTDAQCIQASTEGNFGAPQRADVLQWESDDAELGAIWSGESEAAQEMGFRGL